MAPPPVTEVLYAPLKPGSKPMDFSTSEGKILEETLKTIAAQEGCQRCLYGTQIEDPSTFVLLVQWDTREHHTKFEKQEYARQTTA